MHGRPRKLPPRYSSVQKAPKNTSANRIFENSDKNISKGFTGNLKNLSTNEIPLRKVIAGIFTNILDNVTDAKVANTDTGDSEPQNESSCSLDHSLITNLLGDQCHEALN